MKQFSYKQLIAFVFTVISFSACVPIEDVFDETLLIGKWVSGTEYYRYDEDNTGVSWDTSEDVTEDEAQGFTWTLVNSELTHIHILENGAGGVPKIYTVTELTATTLKYKDDFGKVFTFTRVAK